MVPWQLQGMLGWKEIYKMKERKSHNISNDRTDFSEWDNNLKPKK
jgi:hypothetical protein